MTTQPIHGLTNAQLVERARELLPRGHGVARRIHRQVMTEGRFDPEGFGLGPEASEAWRSEFSFDLPEVVTVQSDEGHHGATWKMVLRLRQEGLKRLNLSISLNAANDPLRSELMPINRRTDLGELQQVLMEYKPRRNFALGVNYCLLPGINDTGADARAVAEFCMPLGRVLVNLIPYNPGSTPLTRAPDEAEVGRFIGWLRAEGLPVRQRVTKGRSVMAACGQLGNPSVREERRARRAVRV